MRAERDAKGRRKLVPTGEPDELHACDEVLIAVGQENAFPWIERDIGIAFDEEWDMPVVDKTTFQSTLPHVHIACDDVLVAIGQENAFPWIERDLGIAFDDSGMPIVDRTTMASTREGIYFGGDSAFGPKNIIWAVAHGHDAAISIDLHCRGEALTERPPPHVNLLSQKMGIHADRRARDR